MSLKIAVLKMLPVFVFIVLNVVLHNLNTPVLAAGNTYYVSSTGSDTNNGTNISTPYKTIPKAINSASAGDTIYVRAGTYPHFVVTKSGSANNYLTISSYNNEPVLITGSSYDGILLKGVSWVRINGFEVTGARGAYGAGISVMHSGSVLPSYNIIENNKVHDNVATYVQGILVMNGSYNKILNNKVYNNYYSGIIVASSWLEAANGVTGNEIIGNESFNNTLGGGNADGIKTEGGGTKNTLISNNTVYGNGDDGIDTWNTSGNNVLGNVSYNHIIGDGNGFKLGGYTNKDGKIDFGGNNVVKNNIAYGNKYNGFESNGSGANYYEGNLAYNNGFAPTSRNAWGIQDGWRANNDTRPSTIINNNAYNNKTANYAKGQYTTTFSGNTEVSATAVPSPVTATPVVKSGDANNDNLVDEKDYSEFWRPNYLKLNCGGASCGDFDNNGKVDGVDYVVWLNNYGK